MTTPKRYRTRETFEAMGPLTRSNATEITQWCGGVWWDEGRIEFRAYGFPMAALLGDMVVLNGGDFFVFSSSLFEEWYEPLEDET